MTEDIDDVVEKLAKISGINQTTIGLHVEILKTHQLEIEELKENIRMLEKRIEAMELEDESVSHHNH